MDQPRKELNRQMNSNILDYEKAIELLGLGPAKYQSGEGLNLAGTNGEKKKSSHSVEITS